MELIKLIITANEDFVLFSPPDVKQNYLLLLAKLNLFRSRLNKDVLLAMTRLNQFSESRCVASKRFSFSTEDGLHEVVGPSVVYGCSSSSRRMVLHSSSTNMEQSFLPSLTDNNRAKIKQDPKMGAKKKSLRQKKEDDDRMFISFPEIASTMQATKKASKSFARKSSSRKASHQSEGMSKSRHSGNKNRRGKVRLPSLVLTPKSERMASEEKWSTALGLRDSYEIPRDLFDKLTDEILKIDRQMKEEEKIRQIRKKRINYDDRKPELPSSWSSELERTSRPGFSYFPCLTRSVGEPLGSKDLFRTEDRTSERILRQERAIRRKIREFKNRHTHYNPTV